MKKGQVTFTTLGIAVIMVSMVAIAYTTFLADLGSKYGVVMNTTFPNSANKLEEITNLTNVINDQVVSGDTTAGNPLEAFASQGASAVKISLLGIPLIRSILLDMSDMLGVPSWFVGGMISILLLVLGLLALTVLMRAFQQL